MMDQRQPITVQYLYRVLVLILALADICYCSHWVARAKPVFLVFGMIDAS